MKPTVWIAILFGVLVLGFVVMSTLGRHAFRCRVCIVFNGGRDCRTASAQTAQGAQNAATVDACTQLSGGVTQSMQCQATQPESVEWLH